MTTTRLSAKLVRSEYDGAVIIYHWCSACRNCHGFQVPRWTFDGNVEKPTFSPSMLGFVTNSKGFRITLCHYILTAGIMNYCGDSPHSLAGKSIPLEDIPPRYVFGDIAMKDLT